MPASDDHYLRHLARAGAAYVHPRSRRGSDILLSRLDLRDGQRVLEIGCGTGATLVHAAARCAIVVEGVDTLPEMVRAARRRIAIAGLGGQARVRLIEVGAPLPFADGSFDGAFAESVLGILDAAAIAGLLAEIARVLAPRGRFVANDSIWRDGTTAADAEAVNSRCLRDFGVRQATAEPWTAADWVAAGRAAGFVDAAWEPMPAAASGPAAAPLAAERRSALYTRAQSWLAAASPRHRVAARRYAGLLAAHQGDRDRLVSGLLVLRRP